jgi:FeS assembly protein IscX
MDRPLDWTDVDDIAFALFEADPTCNPLTLRFTELAERVLALPNFQGLRERCNEKILEAIQMAWLEEFEDA